ncbi:hypothetical protein CI109_105192 [Kwoniella shandongensis]|uniref:Uncharacterized protein n=1 Tax=Kwoniella shandongensis TaxID=1734106 RepID=A0A5M6C8U0_9TREE|nr:uncharacterized protein CI109_002034 [Kwoniella shandongensis]KAA5529609.1 hypothetical protein CI109_002034 [Kwoniella shandongensis]
MSRHHQPHTSSPIYHHPVIAYENATSQQNQKHVQSTDHPPIHHHQHHQHHHLLSPPVYGESSNTTTYSHNQHHNHQSYYSHSNSTSPQKEGQYTTTTTTAATTPSLGPSTSTLPRQSFINSRGEPSYRLESRGRIPAIVIPPHHPYRRNSSNIIGNTTGSSPYEGSQLPPHSTATAPLSAGFGAGAAASSSSSSSRQPHQSNSFAQQPSPSSLSYSHSPYGSHFPGLHSASSSSSIGGNDSGGSERVLRSPHPPLTASLYPGGGQHHYLWPPSLPLLDHHNHSYTHSLSHSNSRSPNPPPVHTLPTERYYTTPLDINPGGSASSSQSPYISLPTIYTSAPPFIHNPHNNGGSPLHIPPPLRFKYSATPPEMPPRKKAAAAAEGAPASSGAATSSTPRTVSSTTGVGSGSRSRKAVPNGNGKGWTMEHTYDSVGQRKEVIVIDDSASPMINQQQQQQPPRKRTRAQVAAEQQALYSQSVSLSNGHAGSNSLSNSTKKRKVDEASEPGSAKKTKGKLASTATSASVQAAAGYQSQQVVQPKAAQYASTKAAAPPVAASQNSAQPAWDDAEGHYIVKPDDVIGGRYKIVRLLGQGTFGKVVEARHIETRKKVAIKVIRAVQKYRDASKIEIRVLETLKKHDPRNDNKCIHLDEYFDFRNHPCLVSELYGMSVFDFLKQNSFQPFPEKHIQDFARSLLKSVAFLHTLKLVHTDLKPENILLCSNEARLVGPRAKNARSKSILRNTEIRLIDFGSATFESEYHSSVVSTRHYRAPEIILGLPWSYPCDMFSIGCILVEFYTGDALFQTHDNLEHLAMMEVVMGKFSPRMIEKGKAKKPEFFRGNKIDFPNNQTSKSSKKYVKQMRTLKDIIAPTTKHQNLFLDLCVRLLEHDPDVRLKVQDALRHPYLTEPIPEPA